MYPIIKQSLRIIKFVVGHYIKITLEFVAEGRAQWREIPSQGSITKYYCISFIRHIAVPQLHVSLGLSNMCFSSVIKFEINNNLSIKNHSGMMHEVKEGLLFYSRFIFQSSSMFIIQAWSWRLK